MQKLLQGLRLFHDRVYREKHELFRKLRNGQSPLALFITCSDSRVIPNLITQTEPGELFTLRNAGNIIPPQGGAPSGEGATVEFAITALGIRDVILCGHAHCGAMRALVEPGPTPATPLVEAWLVHARATLERVKAKHGSLAPAPLLARVIEENVLLQLEHLKTIPEVSRLLALGELKLHGWVYDFETGEVTSYDASSDRFLPFHQVYTTTAPERAPVLRPRQS